ncbi:hypothetical protein [Anaerovibrio sp.]|uniref:hypothetical protein n=1 Tax=Anaerovibrio sp. TaxID=1872532 RepID=UPI0025BCAA2F|nr:hypothetical protein [Anaerovibrio sp.]MBR2142060.1 hypothetical protein [Anaerovibrio sp.]
MSYQEYVEYCMQRRRARLRLELKRKAIWYDRIANALKASGLIILVMLLCGFAENI